MMKFAARPYAWLALLSQPNFIEVLGDKMLKFAHQLSERIGTGDGR